MFIHVYTSECVGGGEGSAECFTCSFLVYTSGEGSYHPCPLSSALEETS